MSDTPEQRVKKRVVALLKAAGVWYFFPASNGFGRAGIPDLICIVEGQFVGIECKADRTKKPTALQLACAESIREAGGVWFLVRDEESLTELETWIKKVQRWSS